MTPLSDATYHRISALMHESIGLCLGDNKQALVASRLAPRIQRLGLAGYDDYLRTISGDADDEFQMAVDLLTTNETYFFREPEHFDLLERELLATRPASFSVWSAACSFGDEPYSLAMLLSDLEGRGTIGRDWSILGTDISDRALRCALSGVMPEERLRHVTSDRLRRYCMRGGGDDEGMAMVQPQLRERVRFGQLNLCRPIDELGPFDAVFLRNVLIYFDQQTKSEVVDRVLSQLKVGGLFFIGIAEGRVPRDMPLEVLQPGAFRKLGTP